MDSTGTPGGRRPSQCRRRRGGRAAPDGPSTTGDTYAGHGHNLSAASSRDGLSLYLGFDIDGGKCGTYEVVIEPKHKAMDAGVVHLPGGGQPCSMQDTAVDLVVRISTPLGLRPVVDLATGKPVVSYAVSKSD